MELFESIRLKIGKKILYKNYARINRKMSYTNLAGIRSIGIIWDPVNADQFSHLSQFVQQMQERNIETKIIGYFPEKVLPGRYNSLKNLTCIIKNELNTFFIPVSDEAVKFMNRKVDILIDINFKRVFPLHYISLLSPAKFKIGLAGTDGESTHYDLMMDIKQPVDISEYLKNIMFYLEMINSGSLN
jgi:hypothetical protein